METITLAEASQAMRASKSAAGAAGISGVSIDTRTLQAGELFFALRGEHTDGHRFVDSAFERGAGAVVVSDSAAQSAEGPVLVVDDTVAALQRLAGWYRSRFDLPVVGITGTNGKTTTKDMTAAVLSTRFRTLKTEGNYNNHIGVPLTLLGLSARHEAAVIEIGMSHPGEVRTLAAIAEPRIGVITNVAEAHLETMGSREAIADAKGELLDALPKDGTAILNGDDELVMSQARRARGDVRTFGVAQDADFRAEGIEERATSVGFSVAGDGTFEVPLPGRHNVANALAAVAVGSVLGVGPEDASRGLSGFESSPLRMKIIEIGDWRVLNDAYNCNPGSLRASLETLVGLGGGRRTAAALGDMLELGPASDSAHRTAGRFAAGLGIDLIYLFGTEVRSLREGALEGGMAPGSVRLFETKDELARALAAELNGPAVILVKGSRGTRMEEVVETLTKEAPAS